MVVLGGGAVSYERGTPVPLSPKACAAASFAPRLFLRHVLAFRTQALTSRIPVVEENKNLCVTIDAALRVRFLCGLYRATDVPNLIGWWVSFLCGLCVISSATSVATDVCNLIFFFFITLQPRVE